MTPFEKEAMLSIIGYCGICYNGRYGSIKTSPQNIFISPKMGFLDAS